MKGRRKNGEARSLFPSQPFAVALLVR